MDNITIQDPKFIKQTLARYGVCVVTNILSKEESDSLFNEMVWDLETRTSFLNVPFRINDPKTWETLEVFAPYHNMMYQNSGIGHAKYIWELRTHPKVLNCFEELWSTKKLICSFDGISFHLPGEISKKKHFCEYEKSWYHVDQSPFRNNFECVQGYVSSRDINDGDAGLTILVGSHNHYSDYFDDVINRLIISKKSKDEIDKKMKSEFQKIDNIEFFTRRNCYEQKITCPAGSIVLWDSRCIHYGSQPSEKRLKPNYRGIVYVSMSSIEMIKEYKYSDKIFVKRSFEYYENQKTTGHNAFLRTLSRSKPKIEIPLLKPFKLTQKMYSMITGEY
jgi:hypothetical protein